MNQLFQELGGAFVRKMAVSAEDALLETPRPSRIVVQQVHVVVGFQQQHFRIADPVGDQSGAVAHVGEKTNPTFRCVQHKAHGIDSIMRDWEGIHIQITDLKGVSGFHEPKVEVGVMDAADFLRGMAIAVHRDAELGGKHLETADVVGMLMRNQNAIQAFRGAVQIQ